MSNIENYTPQQIFSSEKVAKRFEKILGENARGFVASVLQIINDNDKLKNADPESLYSAAMIAASLNLPINPNLGFAYIIPYNIKGRGQVAQFQMGYKGYIQLAQRTGMYKTISAAAIYEGQLVSENPLAGYEFDFNVRSGDKIIGYAAYFKLINGFEKTSYMTVEEIEQHAIEYASTFEGIDNKKSYGNWVDNFDGMAKKTVLKLLLSKFGPLSVDMQTAIKVDQAEIKDVDGLKVSYIDNNREPQQPTEGRKPIDTQKPEVVSDEEIAEGTPFE